MTGEAEKRPKDMTPEERAALPVKSMLEQRRPPRQCLRGDDLLGYWRDDAGQWYRDPGDGFW